MITYLEVTEENVDTLNDRGIKCVEGDELEIVVEFDINRADPEVGINSDDVQVTSVTCNTISVSDLLDEDKLHDEAWDDVEATREDMADQAAEWRRDAERGL